MYTHPSMSEEPLVVLHVALTKEVWEKNLKKSKWIDKVEFDSHCLVS